MKTITIITLQNVRNYGSVLQALATQKIFESLGCEVGFFNYLRSNNATPWVRIKNWTNKKPLLTKVLIGALLYPTFVLQDRRFKKFLNKHLNVQEKVCTTMADFEELELTSDIYCTGSDQTWNSGWNGGILPELFLAFVPEHIKKIAYSASFGKSKLDTWEKEETCKLLARYQAVSVRESTGVDICSELGCDATHVLDPTLQLDRTFWSSYAGCRPLEYGYVLIYQLNTNKSFDRFAKEFAHRKGLRLVRFCTRIDQILKNGKSLVVPEVQDFVRYIFHADYVITDSFHATAFSINVNTQFISIYPNDYSSRLGSILKLVGLEDRHLLSYDDFSLVEAPAIDFSYANKILDEERAKGLDFLRRAIAVSYTHLTLPTTPYV